MQYKVLIFLIFLYATPPRLGSDGGKAAGGLKATAAGTLSDVRTPTAESVGWLLLLFAIEKQLK